MKLTEVMMKAIEENGAEAIYDAYKRALDTTDASDICVVVNQDGKIDIAEISKGSSFQDVFEQKAFELYRANGMHEAMHEKYDEELKDRDDLDWEDVISAEMEHWMQEDIPARRVKEVLYFEEM